MKNRKKNQQNLKWREINHALAQDSVRVKVPRAFLPLLTLFFHHASDAMAGDDRPDHGLAKIRQGREYYRDPFYFLYAKLRRAEKRMRPSECRKAWKLLNRYRDLLKQ